MATDLEKLMLTHYTDNQIHVTPEQRYLLDQGIGDLIDGYTVIQSDLAQVDTILADAIASESIYADFIDTNLLEANKLFAAAIEATYLYANHMDAEVANVISLFANYATIENLTAQRADIDVLLAGYIRASDIIANNLKASQILADSAEIGALLSYSISAEGLASIRVTSEQLVVADGFINDAMIMDLSADKIKSGSIYTNLVDIISENGNLSIMDNTIQIKDSASTPRVQIGKDANADYNMYVWDVDGNLMFDATGIHAEGIKQPIIRNDMVSDLANISGHKLNIESVVTEINDGTATLKSSKIYFDEDGQSLDIKFGSLTSFVTTTGQEAKDYADDKASAVEQAAKSYADTQSNAAKDAANAYYNAQILLEQTRADAYADGVASQAELDAIEEAEAKMVEAKEYADLKASDAQAAAIAAAKLDATEKASAAQTAAETYAKAKAEAERVLAESYADGKVSDEEQARITDVNTKLAEAKLDAEQKADAAKLAAQNYSDGKLADYATTIVSQLDGMQGQIDGSIMTWFYAVPPTNDNPPTVEWTTVDTKNVHLGDLYYDTITGYCYRWQVVNDLYSWKRITDTDVTKALEDASKAQDTADSKRRVFVVTPTIPYDVGDLWAQGTTGELMRCTVSRSTGSYIASDWKKAVKYTDDTTATANLETAKTYAETKANEAKTAAESYAKTKAEAERVLAEAYADGIVDEEEEARILDVEAKLATARTHAETKANEALAASKTYANENLAAAKTYAEGKATDARLAAEAYALAEAEAKQLLAEAYADGVVDAEEAARISDVNAKLATAKTYADTQASAAQTAAISAAELDATSKANAAQSAAETYAKTKAEAERVLAESYADGKVTDEEAARIADVNAKLASAKTYAEGKASEAEAASKEYADLIQDNVDVVADNVSTLNTEMVVANGNISTIITATEIEAIKGLGTSFYAQYNTTKSTVDSWELSLGNESTTFSDVLSSVKTNSAKISATPNTIKASVTSSYISGLDVITSMKSSIELNESSIASKVEKDGIISIINQSPEELRINSNMITIGAGTNFEQGARYSWEKYAGKTWTAIGAKTKTWLEVSRSPEYSPALLSRTLARISASLGTMDYFDDSVFLGETIIIGGFLNTNLIMANSITADKIKANSLSAIQANLGTVTAGMLKSTNGQSYFDLTNNKITTNNADITGKINSTSGGIGGWTIANYGLYNDTLRAGFLTHPSSAIVLYVGNMTYQGMLDNIASGTDTSLPYFYVNKHGGIYANGLIVDGSKHRVVDTENYGRVLLNAYETPRPTFADTGHAQLDDAGLCYIDIDLVFSETIDHTHDYRYFLTKYSQGDLWIKESNTDYFIVEGTPNLEFDWKIEAIQRDYNTYNLEKFEGEDYGIDETNYIELTDEYLREYEKELTA